MSNFKKTPPAPPPVQPGRHAPTPQPAPPPLRGPSHTPTHKPGDNGPGRAA